MTSYSIVMKNVKAKQQQLIDKGVPSTEQYAGLTGMLEINVVTLLDYISIHCGESGLDDALSRISYVK
jgi:hypothetical protein